MANPDDEEAIKRIINYPARGIGATTVLKIADCAHQNQVSFWAVIGTPEQYGLAVNKGTMNKLETFRLLISSFIERAQTTDVYELGDAIIKESGISQDIMSGKDADDLARQENLEEFLSGMSALWRNAVKRVGLMNSSCRIICRMWRCLPMLTAMVIRMNLVFL